MHIALNAHLLHGQAGYRSAGIHQYIWHTLNHLPQVAPEHHYTVMVGTGQPDMPGATLWRTRWPTQRPLVRILWEQLAQPWALWRLRPGLLHSLAFASPLVTPCPHVVTVYDLSFRLMPEKFPPAQRLYLSAITAHTCRTARRVGAISQHGQTELQRLLGVPADKIDVAYPGVEPRFAPLPAEAVRAFRQAQALPDDFILYLGTLEPRKNLPALVRAFAALRARHPQLHLVIAGGQGWYYQSLFDLVAELNLRPVVHFPGYVPAADLPLWYNAARVFAYPSSYEGFGLPVLEALACGTPTVTSTAASLPEAGGPAAWLVPPTEVPALTEALHAALMPDLDRRAAGLAHAARFTWANTARAVAAMYACVR